MNNDGWFMLQCWVLRVFIVFSLAGRGCCEARHAGIDYEKHKSISVPFSNVIELDGAPSN